jgi:RNA polymerase sigma factor (sigma-70 family)
MATTTATQSGIVLRRLRELMTAKDACALPDQQLLDRFVNHREELAFTALVRRHGPLVLGVCRRVLRHEHDAEDAFQATFLVLAQRAASINKRASVSSWLYQVAYHVANKTRKRTINRHKREERAAGRQQADALDEVTGRELLAVLDEELQRLPERDRSPLVLCYLQGLTRDEAARQLVCSESTLHRRLHGARERLRQRLERRGLTLPAALLATGATVATVPRTLAAATTKAAAGRAPVPAEVAGLVQGSLQTLTFGMVKAVAGAVLVAVLVAFGAVAIVPRPPAAAEEPPAASLKAPAAPAADEKKEMTVAGRVLDPDGMPLAEAKVAVLAGVRRFYRYQSLSSERALLGAGRTDAEGRFALKVERTSSDRNWGADVLAAAPGCGLGWESFDPDAERPETTIRLGPEQVVRGQLRDLQGQPAAKVPLQVVRVARVEAAEARLARMRAAEKERAEGNALKMRKDVSLRNEDIYLPAPLDDLPLWPAKVTTDEEGRFALRGVGRGVALTLSVRADRFASQTLDLEDTNEPEKATKFDKVLNPARLIEGRVTYADSGQPAANVEVRAWGRERARTDRDGRFRVSSAQGPMLSGEEKGILMAFPPEGEPYCNTQKEFHWPRGVVKHTLDLALLRGSLVRGKVTEEGTGKPVAGALVRYVAQQDNPNLNAAGAGPYNFANGRDMVATGADGTFRIAGLPGRGYLLIEGPDADYVLRENGGQRLLFQGKRGGPPWRSHGFVALDLKPDAEPLEAAVALRRGVTIEGELAGNDGKAISDLQVFCRLEGFSTHPVKVRGTRFELHGCDPEEKITVVFFDAVKSWGATATLSVREAGCTPVRVALAPCGSAQVRFLDKEGKPLADFYPGLFLVLAPKEGETEAQTLQVVSPFRRLGPHTDGEGSCTFSTLIPGATYRFGYADIATTFTAEAGKAMKMPDVVVPHSPK